MTMRSYQRAKCFTATSIAICTAAWSYSTFACDKRILNGQYEIGVYYYPGWHTLAGRPLATKSPWDPILKFPERKPLLGWYDGGAPDVIQKQMQWMCEYGVDYVVFDWYFDISHPRLDGPLNTYLALDGAKPRFSLLWDNHGHTTTRTEWFSIVNLLADRYFNSKSIYSIEEKPVIFIFSLAKLETDAKKSGETLALWISGAQTLFADRGLKGAYFVGGVKGSDQVLASAKAAGISALSAYNYHAATGDHRVSHNFTELDDVYRRNWSAPQILSTSLPVILPISSGWDRRPWGGSSDPLHDNSGATPKQFALHLRAARTTMDAHGYTRAVVCCWNEYGEGSVIEPTKRWKFSFLRGLRDTFKLSARKRSRAPIRVPSPGQLP